MNTLHFKTYTPMGAQVASSAFATGVGTKWVLGCEKCSKTSGNEQLGLRCENMTSVRESPTAFTRSLITLSLKNHHGTSQ